jgi:hypothetical protein
MREEPGRHPRPFFFPGARFEPVALSALTHFPQIEVNEGENSVIFFGKN